jgi:hypothetical protein
VVKFRQQIESMVDSMGTAGVAPPEFRKLTSGLRAASANAALETLVAVVEAADPITPTIAQGESVLRFRGRSKQQWLTAFGLATVSRRYYAGDDGTGGVVPLDVVLGVIDRCMTPEVEEMVAFASGAMTPIEVEQIMAKALPVAPSGNSDQAHDS